MSNKFNWQGRVDDEDGERGLRWHQAITRSTENGHSLKSTSNNNIPSCNLVGMASDLGVLANKGRVGAKQGPEAIRRALANCAFHHEALASDSGDVQAERDLDECQQQYASHITNSIKRHQLTIGLGGGHEIAWGSYQGLKRAISNNARIGIVNFDAHFDLRKPSPKTSSGTPFRQIHLDCKKRGAEFNYCCLGVARTANTQALFDYAEQSGTHFLLDENCTLAYAKALLTPMLEQVDQLYITVCLDAFSAHLAPGVSAPSPYGISLPFVIETIRWLSESQQSYNYQWQLADIAEMNPNYDIDNRTAKLAARIIDEMVAAKFTA